jgi:RNA polymerase sigma factor (sigma-70 family)
VLTVFSHPDPEQTKYLLANGVLGGIPLHNMSKYLNDAIKVISEKGIFFVGYDTINAEKLAEDVAKLTDLNEALKDLSERQREVVGGLFQGCSNKQIAKDLNIELSTVKTHLTGIYKTLGITGRNQIFNRLGSENKVSQLIG